MVAIENSLLYWGGNFVGEHNPSWPRKPYSLRDDTKSSIVLCLFETFSRATGSWNLLELRDDTNIDALDPYGHRNPIRYAVIQNATSQKVRDLTSEIQTSNETNTTLIQL